MLDSSQSSSVDSVWSRSVPDPGQLVEIRRRQWVVNDVQGSVFSSSGNGKQHLVTLGSIDEDSLGESLQVVWEMEPGARILERVGLPKITGLDPADRLEAFLDAVRWGSATNADRSFLQSPFRSGITIEDYQLDPLVRAIDMARVNLLIADDVGLGKTIEAGLVIQELLVRHRARTVMIVCPATLQVKWQTEMQEKFGLEFRIVDTEYVKALRRERGIHANPWSSFPRLIASIDWMKSGEGIRLLKDILPPHVTYPRKFDILIVDEAHNVAPAAAAQYALESQRTRLIRTISPHFSHRLFLTATPHNGYQESFTSLLELLDDQRFARTVMPGEKQLQRVMVRRMKSDIVDADGNPVFPVRMLECLEVDYSEEERDIHRNLREFTESRSMCIKGTRYAFGTDFVHMLLKKRLFSSPMAFALTLAKHRETLERKRSRSDSATLDDRILRKAIVHTEEEYSDDAKAEEALNEAVEKASELAVPITDAQKKMLDNLTDWAERWKNREDAKAKAILHWLETHLKANGTWNDRRVILFTEYRATLVWLQQILTANGYGGDRLMILHGSMRPDEREIIKAAFQADPKVSPVRILLATDAASEGIDLQNHCNYLIHVEIPWNPNVMEQRNGRIDRHGQKQKEVFIWHPAPSGLDIERLKKIVVEKKENPVDLSKLDGEIEYLVRAIIKVEQMREDLGSVGPVIAQQIEEAMLGKRNTMDTSLAEANAAKARRFLAVERKLQERIAHLHEKLMEAKKDSHLAPENVLRAVTVALELAEKPALKPISMPDIPGGKVFEMPILTGSWGRAAAGLEHPHTKIRRPITFDHDVAKGRDDIVLVHLNHKLVQMSLRLLREELWKLDDIKLLHRVTVRRVPDSQIERPAVAIWSRLIITGGGHHRLHEELTLSGGELDHASFTRITQVGKLETLVEMATPVIPGETLFEILKDRFQRHDDSIRKAVEARSRERMKYLENRLNRRKESEIGDLRSVLEDHEKSIIEELEDSGPQFVQSTFWSEDKRNQLRRDREALRARLNRIPEEKKNETAAIEKRYADPMARTFPVAVVFLVPQGMCESSRER